MANEDILQEIGDFYMSMKNNDRVKAGCAIVIPRSKYKQYLEALSLTETQMKNVKFMDVPLIPSNTDTDQLVFLESQFMELDNAELSGDADAHKAIADVFRNRMADLQARLINKLELEGISFQNDEAFKEFARTQLIIETQGDDDIILYEGKEFLRFKSKFEIKTEKDNDRDNSV